MPPRGNAQISKKHKPVKYSTVKLLKGVFASTVVLVTLSVFVTYNLTTAVKSFDNLMQEESIDDSRKLKKTKSSKDGGKVQPVDKSPNDKQQTTSVAQSDQVLLQWIKDQRKDRTTSSISDLLATPLYYSPGALPLSQLSTFQHCYTDPKIYSNHLSPGGSRRRAPYSEKHKLALVLVPKSGSSTGRFMMKVSEEGCSENGYGISLYNLRHS